MFKKDEKKETAKADKPDETKGAELLTPEVIEAVNGLTAVQAKERMPQLYGKIEAHIGAKIKAKIAAERKEEGPNLNVSGFLLDVDDPYAAGVARIYGQLTGRPIRLPCVLPYKDKHSVKALESYIVRAKGAGDTERAAKAEKAKKKVKI